MITTMLSAVSWGLGLHVSGCSCAACAPQPVRLATSAAPVARSSQTDGNVRVGERSDRYESTITDPADSTDATDPTGAATGGTGSADEPADDTSADQSAAPDELTADELQMIRDLERRDRDVRSHEAAHQSAGAGLVGGASYTFQSGPDGRRYAIGGEVSVDASAEPGDPAATIGKMQRVRAAALAPADPSGQDLAVASAAAQIMAAAQQELTRLKRDEAGDGRPVDKQGDDVKAEEKAKRETEGKDGREAGLMGAKPTDFAAILGNEQRRRWIEMAFGQRPSTGTLVDQSA